MTPAEVNRVLQELRAETYRKDIRTSMNSYEMPDGDWYFDPTLGYWETDQESCDPEST